LNGVVGTQALPASTDPPGAGAPHHAEWTRSSLRRTRRAGWSIDRVGAIGLDDNE
jgi:hypothetical protein